MDAPLVANGKTYSPSKPSVWTIWVMFILAALLIACIVAFPVLLVERAQKAASQSLRCFEVVGGKATGSDLDQLYISSEKCKTVFDAYTKEGGQYWEEVTTTYDAIRAQLIQEGSTTSYDNMIIFDIDETLLSNLDEIQSAGYGLRDSIAWENWVSGAMAPALPGADKLFKDLRAHGYAVALITGRKEKDREGTTKNLKASGFGEECTSSSPSNDEVCYHKLIMRPDDDDRDALIVKSGQRATLQPDFNIIAAAGDQWSDFTGAPRPVSVFKLPNPFYYIL